jgi:nucleoside-diphosphate-sugar epimerase
MKIFVTGATGFIGTALVKGLIEAGHSVRGLTRSREGVKQLEEAGAEPHLGSLEDKETLRAGARGMDAVAHLAFGLDMSKFAENAAVEIEAIETLGSALDPGKLLIVTSGVAAVESEPGSLPKETDPSGTPPSIPRRPDQTVLLQKAKGLHVGIVRMSQIHDTRKQGLVQFLVQIARAKGISAYIGDGESRWAACSLADTARLYRLALEKNAPSATYHAVDEEGVSLKDIAEAIGKGLRIPVVSLSEEEALGHFGPIAPFVSMNLQGSSKLTQEALDWKPSGPGMIDDLSNMDYGV